LSVAKRRQLDESDPLLRGVILSLLVESSLPTID